jgi:lipopolysaccharide/colanic/teichoic acid biosynthesis glycosyltransferase
VSDATASVSPLTTRQAALKRGLDVVASAGGLALGWPLILLGWVAAAVSTRQSGFFRQVRVGRGGEPFTVIKLRTMRAVSGLDTTVTAADDVRITATGAWLRRCKLDELPQLVNVLRGHMSLVGPRPDVPGFADRLEGPERVLLTLRPGITGPATLAYRDEELILASVDEREQHNRDVIWPDKVQLNLTYLRDWSLAGDLRYVWATIRPERHRDAPGRAHGAETHEETLS